MRAKIERKKVNLLIPVELLDRVIAVEKGRYRTFTELVVELLLKHVEKEEEVRE